MTVGSLPQNAQPLVTVVVPTIGRPQLARAIESVQRQASEAAFEIVIVVDRPDSWRLEGVQLPPDAIVIYTGGEAGAGAARNMGVAASNGDYIAFLDDDDEWTPNKLRDQLAAARRIEGQAAQPVVVGRHRQDAGGRISGLLPTKLYNQAGGNVESYLFARRRPGAGRASMYTSTIFTSRKVARDVKWDESLRRHQDWDWLIRACDRRDVSLSQVPDQVAVIHSGTAGSISASSNWSDSLIWARAVLRGRNSRVYVDFLAAQTLRYAIQARSLEGVRRCFREIAAARTVPSTGPILVALAGLLPRPILERLMTVVR